MVALVRFDVKVTKSAEAFPHILSSVRSPLVVRPFLSSSLHSRDVLNTNC